jgi:MFS family permease
MNKSHAIYTIAIIGFIYALHMVIPMYSASSFLSQYIDEQMVSYVYMIGAALTILGLVLVPSIIRKLGDYSTTLWLILIQAGLFYGLVTTTNPLYIIVFFVLQTTIITLIGLTLDVFLEKYTDTANVGSVRGLYNTSLNASWMIGPLIGSMLVDGGDVYVNTYIAGLFILIPLFYLIYKNFRGFKDPQYKHYSPVELLRHVSKNLNWDKLFCANIILQTFYAWMVIYSPIYLHHTIGLSWNQIGIILVVMLAPFVFIPYPLGKLADKFGEKTFMIVGFIIMAGGTIALSWISIPNVYIWAIGLFITRLGASIAESMMETYFFKTTSARDTAALGMFRLSRPVSYFVAPALSIVGLYFVSESSLFIVVGVFCLIALIPVLTIKDAK